MPTWTDNITTLLSDTLTERIKQLQTDLASRILKPNDTYGMLTAQDYKIYDAHSEYSDYSDYYQGTATVSGETTGGCVSGATLVICPHCGHIVDPLHAAPDHVISTLYHAGSTQGQYHVAQCNMAASNGWTTSTLTFKTFEPMYPPIPEPLTPPDPPVLLPLVEPAGRRQLSLDALPDE